MKEPNKIRLSDFNTKQKEPNKIRLKSIHTQKLDLYDDFGYITSLEIKSTDDEDHNKNNQESL